MGINEDKKAIIKEAIRLYSKYIYFLNDQEVYVLMKTLDYAHNTDKYMYSTKSDQELKRWRLDLMNQKDIVKNECDKLKKCLENEVLVSDKTIDGYIASYQADKELINDNMNAFGEYINYTEELYNQAIQKTIECDKYIYDCLVRVSNNKDNVSAKDKQAVIEWGAERTNEDKHMEKADLTIIQELMDEKGVLSREEQILYLKLEIDKYKADLFIKKEDFARCKERIIEQISNFRETKNEYKYSAVRSNTNYGRVIEYIEDKISRIDAAIEECEKRKQEDFGKHKELDKVKNKLIILFKNNTNDIDEKLTNAKRYEEMVRTNIEKELKIIKKSDKVIKKCIRKLNREEELEKKYAEAVLNWGIEKINSNMKMEEKEKKPIFKLIMDKYKKRGLNGNKEYMACLKLCLKELMTIRDTIMYSKMEQASKNEQSSKIINKIIYINNLIDDIDEGRTILKEFPVECTKVVDYVLAYNEPINNQQELNEQQKVNEQQESSKQQEVSEQQKTSNQQDFMDNKIISDTSKRLKEAVIAKRTIESLKKKYTNDKQSIAKWDPLGDKSAKYTTKAMGVALILDSERKLTSLVENTKTIQEQVAQNNDLTVEDYNVLDTNNKKIKNIIAKVKSMDRYNYIREYSNHMDAYRTISENPVKSNGKAQNVKVF